MDESNSIQLFEDRKIRTAWDEEQEQWYFSVQDVIAVLADSSDPKQYIKKMRARDPELSVNWGTICTQVKMPATDGKYKNLKGLKKENLRDNMSTMEIVLNMLAEATTTELSKAHRPEGFSESQKIARRGGSYAGQVRQDIEKDTGRPVITSQNAAQFNAVVVDMIESLAETEKPDNDENK